MCCPIFEICKLSSTILSRWYYGFVQEETINSHHITDKKRKGWYFHNTTSSTNSPPEIEFPSFSSRDFEYQTLCVTVIWYCLLSKLYSENQKWFCSRIKERLFQCLRWLIWEKVVWREGEMVSNWIPKPEIGWKRLCLLPTSCFHNTKV